MKRILILGASIFQIPVVKQAKKMNLFVGIVDISREAPAIPYADVYFQCSIKDAEAVLKIAKEFKPNAICVGICDSAMNTAAILCEKLGLPGTSVSVAKCATDKYEMIKAFDKYDVPHPKYCLVKKNEIEHQDVDLKYPLISKPTDSAGSKGICVIDNKTHLYDSLKESSKAGTSGDVLVEEMMNGREVSVELIVEDGVPFAAQVTDKLTTGAPHFIEIGHAQPSTLSDEKVELIKKVACQAAIAVGLQNSIAHAELFLTSEGPKMVEIAGRLGGGGIAEQLIVLSTGINMAELTISYSLGMENQHPKPSFNRASVSRFILSKDGVVESIDGIEDARKIPGVTEVSLFFKNGDKFHDAVDNSGRIGYVIATANKQEDAVKICEEAINKIIVSYKKCEVNES